MSTHTVYIIIMGLLVLSGMYTERLTMFETILFIMLIEARILAINFLKGR